MRILLAQNALYHVTHGGANRVNRLLLEMLAARGHECRVVCPATGFMEPDNVQPWEGDTPRRLDDQSLEYCSNGVLVRSTPTSAQLTTVLRRVAAEFSPDCLLVPTEDPFQQLLRTALLHCNTPVVYFAHTTLMLPFGPFCWYASKTGTELLRHVALVLTPSRYLAGYFAEWGKMTATTVRLPVFGHPPFKNYGRFDGGYVLMVNPSKIKGIDIFLDLARAFPGVQFAAVASWATSDEDRAALTSLQNVLIFEPRSDLDAIYASARLLVVPSLWNEAFGLVVVEAMLRGIPVLASNVGGLPEAKCGVDYVLPVNPILKYEHRFTHRLLPEPVVPVQDTSIWIETLGRLLSDREFFETLSKASRVAAHEFVESCRLEEIEQLLSALPHVH